MSRHPVTELAAERPAAYAAGPIAGLQAASDAVHVALDGLLREWMQTVEWGGLAGATGLSPTDWFVMEARLPSWVARQLEGIADRLPCLPLTAAAYVDGDVTFDDLAHIVRASRDVNGARLGQVDEYAASAARGLSEAGDGYLLADQVRTFVDSLRAPGWAQRVESRAKRGNHLTTQQDFDGGGVVYAELDPMSYSPTVAGLEAKAGPPSPDVPRGRQRADALVALATEWLGGTTGSDGAPARAARATMTLVIDLASATTDRFADLLRVSGMAEAPTLSARLTETLAEHAELLVQIADGRRPLAELRAADIPAAVRRAVVARDKGCRAPRCNAPPSYCDVHHIVPRAEGGPHTVENLALLCRTNHRAVDTVGWRLELTPTTGQLTWTHPDTGRRYATMPHGARPRPARPPDLGLPDWLAPPVPDEPPDDPLGPPAIARPDPITDPRLYR